MRLYIQDHYYIGQKLLVTSCRLTYRSNTAHSDDCPHARQDCCGNGKWCLSDIIRALNLLQIKHTVIGRACCLDKEQICWIFVQISPKIWPVKTKDKFLLVSSREHVRTQSIKKLNFSNSEPASARSTLAMVALCSGDFKLYSDASSITPCQLVIELDALEWVCV